MLTSTRQPARLHYALSVAVGVMLAGIATAPVHAETIRERQWHLDAMHADEMWETTTGRGITVAVIDSGVDKNVADLRGQVLDGMDYSGLEGDEHADQAGHGTGMASLIAATGARSKVNGSHGLAPGTKILPIKMPYATGGFGTETSGRRYSESLIKAIRFAADSEAKVINVSMGSANTPGKRNVGTPELTAAVKYALGKGKLIFAAVGNSGDVTNAVEYPAATPGVVGVAGVDQKAKPLENSQFGPQVDLAAPGKDIVGACPEGTQICGGTGTSASSALASASAALLWSQHPDWTNNQVLRVLMQTASGNDKGLSRDDVVGYGVIRPRIALKTPGDPGPADKYPIPGFTYEDAKPSSSEPAKPSGPAGSSDQPTVAPAASNDDSSATGLWIAAGIGAAVVLCAAIAVPVLRNRRRLSASTAPAVPPQYGGQQLYYPHAPTPPQRHGLGQQPHTTAHNEHREHDGGSP
ncbi:type VII secretion-associated serine protease mycosin [Streptomyces tirandamycinicus]|uniref:Type VII secretion-associated serine protease mycosin n=1 Tax=Streptomyces tirandamycinicus TaxID=2174846 RepID=A0A2S1T2Q0_9ACTN|nr:type VII secretion-associated serine protease mycosin [Streptomyces tirandamycinicus]AWI32932.1 type VII secretion-associated serine protease mycosin [Streptomyces tirandamycinicus]